MERGLPLPAGRRSALAREGVLGGAGLHA